MSNVLPTRLAYDPECLDHDNGSMIVNPLARDWIKVPHAESPARISRAYEVLVKSGRLAELQLIECPLAGEDTLRLVHTAGAVARIKSASAGSELVSIGPEARAASTSWRPALKAAGGAVAAIDAVLAGDVYNAYVLVRPPGHHASAAVSMGFCLFNNVAIACRHAQAKHGVEKVAIVDWDVHHGNGTQDVFFEDPNVLFISLHQDGLYPSSTGTLSEVGAGAGRGFNVNIPLPAGSGDHGYAHAFENLVEPIIRRFGPDLILVSAGQDASGADPLGRMSVTTEGFRDMSARITALAKDLCGGRLVAVQEGGYSLDHLPYCTLAIIEAMAGLVPVLPADPLEMDVPTHLQNSEVEAVRAAHEVHSAHWHV